MEVERESERERKRDRERAIERKKEPELPNDYNLPITHSSLFPNRTTTTPASLLLSRPLVSLSLSLPYLLEVHVRFKFCFSLSISSHGHTTKCTTVIRVI